MQIKTYKLQFCFAHMFFRNAKIKVRIGKDGLAVGLRLRGTPEFKHSGVFFLKKLETSRRKEIRKNQDLFAKYKQNDSLFSLKK